MRIITIDIPLYKNKAIFAITPDQGKAKAFFKKNYVNISNWPSDAHALTWTKDGCYVYCYLPGIKTAKDMSALSHELVHIAWHMLQDVGVVVTHDNHEALTYLITYLSREVLKSK